MNFKNNDLYILAGGKGTRIAHIEKRNPKSIIKFNNIPLLSIILRQVSIFNFRKIYILAGYKASKIINIYNKKIFNFIEVNVIKEKKNRGTWWALKTIKNRIKNNFYVLNGDTFYDKINFKLFQNFKLKKNKLIMMITNNHQYTENLKLNGIYVNKKRNIIYKKNNYINSGYYFFFKSVFCSVNKNACSIENEIIPFLIKKKRVSGIINNKRLIDIGTPKNLYNAKKELPKLLTRPAVFLDRDGVINKDKKYVYKFKDFKFRKGVIKALKYLTKKNYYIFIVTNQAGIAKKYFTEKDFITLHKKLKNFLLKKNIFIHDVKYCPYHPMALNKKYRKKTELRKPGNLMIKQLFREWLIKKNKSFMIGDKLSDKLTANKSKVYFEYAQDDIYKQVKSIDKKINSNNYF